MTVAEALQFLQTVTYKPEYDIRLRCEGNQIVFGLTVVTNDSCDPKAIMCLRAERRWHAYDLISKAQLTYDLEAFFRNFELHEMYEWLKVEGQVVRNPHSNVR